MSARFDFITTFKFPTIDSASDFGNFASDYRLCSATIATIDFGDYGTRPRARARCRDGLPAFGVLAQA